MLLILHVAACLLLSTARCIMFMIASASSVADVAAAACCCCFSLYLMIDDRASLCVNVVPRNPYMLCKRHTACLFEATCNHIVCVRPNACMYAFRYPQYLHCSCLTATRPTSDWAEPNQSYSNHSCHVLCEETMAPSQRHRSDDGSLCERLWHRSFTPDPGSRDCPCALKQASW